MALITFVTRANLTNSNKKSDQYVDGVAQLPDNVSLSAPNNGTLSGTVIVIAFKGIKARDNVVVNKGPTNGTFSNILSILAIEPTETLMGRGLVAVPD